MPKQLPQLINQPIKAGFPNPAEDARGEAMVLNDLLVSHPLSTYYLRVDGDSMIEAGIRSDDLVVVDKSLEAKSGDVVVAAVDGEFTLKYLRRSGQKAWLVPANPDFEPIELDESRDVSIWGVVTFVIHQQRRRVG